VFGIPCQPVALVMDVHDMAHPLNKNGPAASTAQTSGILQILLASLAASAVLSLTTFTFLSAVTGPGFDPDNKKRLMAVTVCGIVPLIVGAFKSTKGKAENGSTEGSTEAIQEVKNASRTSISSNTSAGTLVFPN